MFVLYAVEKALDSIIIMYEVIRLERVEEVEKKNTLSSVRVGKEERIEKREEDVKMQAPGLMCPHDNNTYDIH